MTLREKVIAARKKAAQADVTRRTVKKGSK